MVPKTISVRRLDAPMQMAKPRQTPEGWLECDGILTRAGVFRYQQADGTERRELRLPEEVFNPDSMRSFHLRPVTDGHPETGWLDSGSAKQFSCGAVDLPVRDGDSMKAHMLITDPDLVKKITSREKVQISNGYFADLELRSGEYQGEPFDAIQRNIRGNHVAIVDEARAGPDARIKLDAADAIAMPGGFVVPSKHSAPKTREDAKVMHKIRIDGVDYEVPEQTAQAFQKKLDALHAESKSAQGKIDAMTAENGKLSGRADGLAEELKKQTDALKTARDPKAIREAVSARVALESAARAILGDEPKLDDLSDREVRVAAVSKFSPGFKADGRSDDYITARFDAACEVSNAQGSGISAARVAVTDDLEEPAHRPAVDPEEQFKKDSQAAWKRPLSAGRRNGEVKIR